MSIRAEIDAIEDINNCIEPVETGNWTKLLLSKRDNPVQSVKDLKRLIAELDPNRS